MNPMLKDKIKKKLKKDKKKHLSQPDKIMT